MNLLMLPEIEYNVIYIFVVIDDSDQGFFSIYSKFHSGAGR